MVFFLAQRGEGATLYQRQNIDMQPEEKEILEAERLRKIDRTLELVQFTPVQESILSTQLDQIASLRI